MRMSFVLLAVFCLGIIPPCAEKVWADDAAPNWIKVTDKAGWQPRDSQGEVVYKDQLWIFGGWFDSFKGAPRDVWSSPDGKTWKLVTENAAWKHSDLSMSLVFKDKMWMMGGWFINYPLEVEITRKQIDRVAVHPPNPFLPITSLSGGNQQKVVLAKWLAYLPKILILNEPTRGIDVGAKDEILRLIRNLRQEGVSIILISSEPEIILANSDRIVVMSKGRIKEQVVNEGLTKEILMTYAG